MRTSLLLMVFSFVSIIATAQKKMYFTVGYIILPDSSLKAGYVQELDSLPSNICRFKDSINSVAQQFNPTQIKGYGFFRGKSFVSFRTRENAFLFFEQLNKGEIKFYKALSVYLIQSHNDRLIELTRARYRSTLSEMLSGCPFVDKKIGNVRLERKSLVWIANQYNACTSDPDEFRGTAYVRLQAGLYVTIANSTTKFQSNPGYPQFSGRSVTNHSPLSAGVQVWLNRPYLSKRIFIRTGAMYGQQSITVASQDSKGGYQANITYNEIEIPISAQVFLGSQNKFFVRAGTSFSIVNNLTSYLSVDTVTPSVVYIDETVPVTTIRKNPPIQLGFGAQFPISGKHKIIVEGTYANGSGYFGREGTTTNIDAKFETFSLTAGLVW